MLNEDMQYEIYLDSLLHAYINEEVLKKGVKMNESELSDKIAEVFYTYAEEIQHLDQQELIEVIIFLQKIRADIESGRYDNETKKWSDLEWRV